MELHRPDNTLIKAINLFKWMQGEFDDLPSSLEGITQEEKDNLLVYLITNKNNYIEDLYKRNQEYQDVFSAIGRFIPHGRPTVYG